MKISAETLNNLLNVLKTRKFWSELFLMTFVMGVTAVAVHYFLQPSKLIVGSISGLSIVLFRLSGLPVSVWTFIINLFLIVLAYLLIGKEFGTKTVYTALVLSPWLALLEYLDKKFDFDPSSMLMTPSGEVDYWFYMFGFILILSFAQAVLFKINASTGGLDILAKIVNKYLHIDIGTSVTVAGAAICCSAFLIPGNSIYLVIMGFFGTWLNGIVVDYFSVGLNTKKRICIISPEYDRVRKFIVEELNRGVSMYEVTGGYSKEKKYELESILTRDEYAKLMQLLVDENIKGFITAGNVSEVHGQWNKQSRRKRK
ncbi:MAG: YitT family protein [Bacteroidales bacterium]|nr:YitT family protein [Bacteroidales bacterium]